MEPVAVTNMSHQHEIGPTSYTIGGVTIPPGQTSVVDPNKITHKLEKAFEAGVLARGHVCTPRKAVVVRTYPMVSPFSYDKLSNEDLERMCHVSDVPAGERVDMIAGLKEVHQD